MTAREKATKNFWQISQELRKPMSHEQECWLSARLAILHGCSDGHLKSAAANALDWLARGEGKAA